MGAPQGILPTATVHDMSGADMTGRSGYGALDAGSETGKGIVRYTYTPDDVDTVMAFTLAFTLADWEATPIASVSTDPCWVMPLIDLSGQVVMADGVTPVENASVTPLSGDLAATVTDTNGNFTVSGLADTGSNYRFFIEADGYIGKIVDHTRLLNDSLVTLDAVEGGDAIISGIVSFRYDPGYTQETMALVRIQKADGSWVTDGSGNVMEVFTDRVDGTYAIVVPEADMGNTVTLVVEAEGYLTSSVGSIDVSSGTATVNVQLNAATRIFIDSQPVDVEPADGTYDQVQVSVSAKAGLIDDAFDGIKGEIAISDADGNAVPDPDYESGTRTYTYTHAMYEAFGLTVRADASDLLRDVDTGYVAATAWYYVPSATNAEEIIIGDTALGGSLESISGNTLVRLAPGGIYGNAGRSVILSIVEADADQAGTAGYSGSGLSVIELLNIDGTPLPNEEIDEILITMAFDGSITEDQLRTDAAYTIYYADTLADLVAGNYSGSIPVDRIVGVTYDQNGGWVTFRTNHLTAFGLFSTSEDLTVSEDEGGRSCFIGVTGQPDRVPLWMLSLMGLLAVAWVRYSNGIS
ncbi:MAG: hypothetical protein CR984_04620 [Proteobacteria bacterium]|nr:MAG: hypothetical protein CR984_04620 [Pseudomonadota bacterium]